MVADALKPAGGPENTAMPRHRRSYEMMNRDENRRCTLAMKPRKLISAVGGIPVKSFDEPPMPSSTRQYDGGQCGRPRDRQVASLRWSYIKRRNIAGIKAILRRGRYDYRAKIGNE